MASSGSAHVPSVPVTQLPSSCMPAPPFKAWNDTAAPATGPLPGAVEVTQASSRPLGACMTDSDSEVLSNTRTWELATLPSLACVRAGG